MNGMEHYRAAEDALRVIAVVEAADTAGLDSLDAEDRAALIAIAQVHATLALAAVNALTGPWRDDTSHEWGDTFARPTRVASSSRGAETDG